MGQSTDACIAYGFKLEAGGEAELHELLGFDDEQLELIGRRAERERMVRDSLSGLQPGTALQRRVPHVHRRCGRQHPFSQP